MASISPREISRDREVREPASTDARPKLKHSSTSQVRDDVELSELAQESLGQESITAIAIKMVEKYPKSENTFQESLANILGHLDFDPDGGVGNLTMQSQPGQLSKLVLINKGSSGKIITAVLFLRVLINLRTILYGAFLIVFFYFSPAGCPEYLRHEQTELAEKTKLPVPEIALVVASIEFAWAIKMVVTTLYNIGKFLMTRLSSSELDVEDTADAIRAYKKYHHLAQFAWNDLNELAGFSALSILALVHPGLIAHQQKEQCSSAERASLALLKNYLCVSGDENKEFKKLTASQVRHLGLIRLLRLQLALDKQKGTNKALEVGHHNQHASMRSLLSQIKEEDKQFGLSGTPRTPNTQYQALRTMGASDEEVAPDVLKRVWRVQVVAGVEAAMFWLTSLFLFSCGAAAFTLKLASTAVHLLGPHLSKLEALLLILAFLNQVLGIIQPQKLLRWRIFRFIFGGQDAEVAIEEKLVERMYEARLAQAIWTAGGMTFFERLVMLVTLNDDDLQRLMLEEVEHKKNHMVVPLWEAVGKDERNSLKGFFHTHAVKWAKGE